MHAHHSRETDEENLKKTLVVLILTVITMIAEIYFGIITGSMALLADGLHMSTHAVAFALSLAGYILVKKFRDSASFPCGTDKIGTLTAYTSALFLGITGIRIIFDSFERLIHPVNIIFDEAIFVAFIGLVVNLICIFVMENPFAHHHEHCEEHCEDYNFKAAYYHVLADILTSLLAIAALFAGKYFNVIIFDTLTGFLGGFLILKWSASLVKKTVCILTDMKSE